MGRPPTNPIKRQAYDQARQDREQQAYRMRLAGRSVADIATEMGVTEQQTRTYLRRVKDRIKAELLDGDRQAGVVAQYSLLTHVAQEALQAWHQRGGVWHLRVALEAARDLRALLGLDAPTVHRVIAEAAAQAAPKIDYSGMSQAELYQLYRETIATGKG